MDSSSCNAKQLHAGVTLQCTGAGFSGWNPTATGPAMLICHFDASLMPPCCLLHSVVRPAYIRRAGLAQALRCVVFSVQSTADPWSCPASGALLCACCPCLRVQRLRSWRACRAHALLPCPCAGRSSRLAPGRHLCRPCFWPRKCRTLHRPCILRLSCFHARCAHCCLCFMHRRAFANHYRMLRVLPPCWLVGHSVAPLMLRCQPRKQPTCGTGRQGGREHSDKSRGTRKARGSARAFRPARYSSHAGALNPHAWATQAAPGRQHKHMASVKGALGGGLQPASNTQAGHFCTLLA